MGAIKDIVDLTKDLKARAKERRDMDVIHKIQSLAFTLQSQHADIIERDVRLMEENAALKRQLEESNTEEIRIHCGIEFRRGKRTGGQWFGFCPQCHLPAADWPNGKGVGCSSSCDWSSSEAGSIAEAIRRMGP